MQRCSSGRAIDPRLHPEPKHLGFMPNWGDRVNAESGIQDMGVSEDRGP